MWFLINLALDCYLSSGLTKYIFFFFFFFFLETPPSNIRNFWGIFKREDSFYSACNEKLFFLHFIMKTDILYEVRFRASKTGLSPQQFFYWPFQSGPSVAVLLFVRLRFRMWRFICHSLAKTRLFKYIENFTTKQGKFSDKKLWYFSYFC